MGGSTSGITFSLFISVEQVIKSKLAAGTIVAATGVVTQPSQSHAVSHDRGIFFLSSGERGALRLVSPLTGCRITERDDYIPLPSTVPSARVQLSGAPEEQVMLELLAAMESGAAIPAGGMINVLWEYQANPTASVRSVFRRWMTSNSPRLIATSLQALVPKGDVDALNRIAPDSSLKDNPVSSGIYEAVSRFRSQDPSAIAVLGRLATTTSSPTPLRNSAAFALASIHTQQTLPYLAALLADPSPTLQAAGVGGLSSFANNVPISSHEPAAGAWKYRTDDTIAHSAFDERLVRQRQAYYLGFWKNWWAQNQVELSK